MNIPWEVKALMRRTRVVRTSSIPFATASREFTNEQFLRTSLRLKLRRGDSSILHRNSVKETDLDGTANRSAEMGLLKGQFTLASKLQV